MTTPAQLCRDLTAVGNVYADGWEARAVARLIRVVTEMDAEAYCCSVCGRWHVRRAEKGLRVVG